MPFQAYNKLKHYNHSMKNNSLHAFLKLSSPNGKKSKYDERVSSFTSKKGSLTVEAALVLPIFLFAISFMMYFTEIVRIQAEIGNELYKQSKTLSLNAYAYNKAQESDMIASGQIEGFVAGTLSNVYINSQVKEELGTNYLVKNNIENGISLILSTYMEENDVIDVVAIYKIKIPCNFFQLNQIHIMQRARIRAWTGYDAEMEEENQEEIVYITKNGSVYHKDVQCTHINLSISQVASSEVKNLRNSSGGKYYECELCGDEQGNGTYYITDTGDRYHKIRECSGIRRGVIAVSISNVGDRGACSRCAR